MAQKIKILMMPRGMQKKMMEDKGYSKSSIFFALTGRTHSALAQEIRDLAIAEYGAFTRPTNY